MPWMACRTLCVGMVKQRGLVFGFPPFPPGQAQGRQFSRASGVQNFFSSYLSLRFVQKKMQQEMGVMGSFFAQRSSKGK